ncbi:MAG: DUF1295 domain-containing protein [Phycisphaerales bacterium]
MTLSPLEQCAIIAGATGLIMLAGWLVQERTRDAGIVDCLWAACLGASALFAAFSGAGDVGRRMLVGAMGGIWGVRLALHILFDRVLVGREDGRYQMMRHKLGGQSFRTSIVFLAFFQAQALLVALLCWPFLMASADGAPFPRLTDLLGGALWIVGLAGEWTADRQLLAWKADAANAGRVCDAGLWRYSRHPNYFFEWLMWCAYALLALGFSPPWGWLALLAPAFMLVLVLKVTGIPPTEARSLKSRGEAYRRYQQTTSAFFPWIPRRASPADSPAASTPTTSPDT